MNFGSKEMNSAKCEMEILTAETVIQNTEKKFMPSDNQLQGNETNIGISENYLWYVEVNIGGTETNLKPYTHENKRKTTAARKAN